jgi:hypothetical protein
VGQRDTPSVGWLRALSSLACCCSANLSAASLLEKVATTRPLASPSLTSNMGPSWVTRYVLMALNMTWIQGHPKWVMEGVCRTSGNMAHCRMAKEPIVQVIRHPSSPPTFQETVAIGCTFALASRKADVAREGDGLVGRVGGADQVLAWTRLLVIPAGSRDDE